MQKVLIHLVKFEVLPIELKTVMMKNFQQLTGEIAHFIKNGTFEILETAISFPKQLN